MRDRNRFEKLDPDLKERILHAAVEEFGRYGFSSASMNRVVRAAGISKGALFKYFGTKAALFDHIHRFVLDSVKTTLKEARDKSAGEPFFRRLERVMRAGLEMVDRRPLYAAIHYRVIFTGDAPRSGRIRGRVRDESVRFLRALIEDGMAAGDLRRDMDAGRAAFILQSVLDRFLQVRYRDVLSPLFETPMREDVPSEAWIEEIVTIFRQGMSTREEGRES